MISKNPHAPAAGLRHQPSRKLAALVLVVASLGLPINDLPRYALLLISAIIISVGSISARRGRWLVAIAAAAACIIGQILLAAPRIEEGHNIFLIDAPGGAVEKGLPAAAFLLMAAEFDAKYPPERRCSPATAGCWRAQAFPQKAFAFSADGIYDRPAYSRRVTGIDFADPVWLRLGFINEAGYNWDSRVSDVKRASRDPRLWALLHRWRLEMPWFVMYRFPAEFVGSSLCWRGAALWEDASEQFNRLVHGGMQCRMLEPADVGRRIFGVAITEPLAMELRPGPGIAVARLIAPGLALLGGAGVIALLVSFRGRRVLLAFAAAAITLAVVLLHDASFIGGLRPFDSGDDGLVYDGMARAMLQELLAGNIAGALEGTEKVFYFTPGMRYLRAVEHLIFGETYFGYLSLVALLPFLVFFMFRRFLPVTWALAVALIFAAVPIGMLFGSSLLQYVKWAARGFADPAACVLFLAGFVLLAGRTAAGQHRGFWAAWSAGSLFALALLVRPNITPAAAVLLTGAGVFAFWQRQYRRLAGLATGFLPVLGAALHNWVYGGVLALFTTTAAHPGAMVMPPSAYLAALGELMRFDLGGEHVARALHQIAGWLAGPSESFLLVPLHVAAIVVLARMAVRKQVDPWLRLTAWATLVQQGVGILYAPAARYYYLTWLLTLLVVMVWVHTEGLMMFRRRYPACAAWASNHPARLALARVLQQAAKSL